MAKLTDIFDDVLKAAIVAIRFDRQRLDGEIYRFSYTDCLYDISGVFEVGGHWYRSGDGYETPTDKEFVDGYAELYSLSVARYDEIYNGYRAIDSEETEAFTKALADALNGHMKQHYPG